MLKKLLLTLALLVMIPTVSFAQSVHTVRSGDTMWKISVWYQVGLPEIIGANPHIKNPALIYPGQKITVPDVSATKSIENQVISLTNQERAKHGLKPLAADWQLSRVARHKSEDMRDKNYFQHNSPTYGTPFDMIKSFGISYRSAGENIAAGQRTPQEVVKAWMDSPGHRENILKSSYTHIGVGHTSGGSYGDYWTQMFIAK